MFSQFYSKKCLSDKEVAGYLNSLTGTILKWQVHIYDECFVVFVEISPSISTKENHRVGQGSIQQN